MSWDITFYRFDDGSPREPDEEGEIHADSLGSYEELKTVLSKSLPIRWEDSGWGTVTSANFTIEFNMPSESNEFDGLTLHIDEPEFALHAVRDVALANGWHVFDHQEGRFIDIEHLAFLPIDEDELDDFDADDEFSEKSRRPEVEEIRYL